MMTDFVPGARMTHDQLHVRAIGGVPIPNTNIVSDVGRRSIRKISTTLEAQRGGYSAAYGDRSYGVFDVVPRTGFERDKARELYTSFGTFAQTNDHIRKEQTESTRASVLFMMASIRARTTSA